MKRFIISLLLVVTLILINKDKIVIPKDAIRIRVIASSNSSEDQKIKSEVKKELEDEMFYLLKNVKSVDKARIVINDNLEKIDNKIYNLLENNNYNTKYNLNFGYNYFPKKEYKGITYQDGMYESLVITLGEGKGDNWWCVMFPPFCLIEARDNNTSNIEYRMFIKDLINKYIK